MVRESFNGRGQFQRQSKMHTHPYLIFTVLDKKRSWGKSLENSHFLERFATLWGRRASENNLSNRSSCLEPTKGWNIASRTLLKGGLFPKHLFFIFLPFQPLHEKNVRPVNCFFTLFIKENELRNLTNSCNVKNYLEEAENSYLHYCIAICINQLSGSKTSQKAI